MGKFFARHWLAFLLGMIALILTAIPIFGVSALYVLVLQAFILWGIWTTGKVAGRVSLD
jgi:hypothetical protein